jgi:excinuclease ABC subunit A
LELSPEGGGGGGEIVAVGTPEDIAAEPRSYTGHYLKQVLKRRPSAASGKRPAATEAAE